MSAIIKKGTKVLCPSCKKEMFEMIADVPAHTRLACALFLGINGYNTPSPGTLANSFCCGATYFHNGKIFTANGWIP